MNFKELTTNPHQSWPSPDKLLGTQLLWVLLLRVILYTLLLGITVFLQSEKQEIILPPYNWLVFFIGGIYLSAIGSGLLLLSGKINIPHFGFLQIQLDIFFTTLLVFGTGSSYSAFTPLYFFPIISCGLLYPQKGGLLAAATVTLQYALALTLEQMQIGPAFLDQYPFFKAQSLITTINHFAVLGLTWFLAALLSAIFARRLIKTEAALSQTTQSLDSLSLLYKQIFDDIASGIITIDHDNRISSANTAAGRITGHNPAELQGQFFSQIFPSLNVNTIGSRLTADLVRQDGVNIRIGYSCARLQLPIKSEEPAKPLFKNNSSYFSFTNGIRGRKEMEKSMDYFLTAPKGNHKQSEPHESSYKLLAIQDISEVERLEQQVRQAEKLAAIGRISADIAHDFRNPLTAISGSAQILAQDFSSSDSPEQRTNRALINIILRESNRLTHTIADFLKFARPEMVEREWFSLRKCLDEVLQVSQDTPLWPANCTLQIEVDPNYSLWADQHQIFTVLSHLLHNALPFCPQGAEIIRIEAKEITLTENRGEIMIQVGDNGTGIEEENWEKIFEPFYTRRVDGTGLGLAIVKQILNAHHGTIEVGHSELGGALFTVHLPLP